MRFGLALLRGVVGVLFMGHGLQKLTGRFGGHGLEGTGKFFESLGLRPGRRHALAAGASETAGGALLAAGLLTPLGASLISGTMITAIRKVHGAKGPWVTDGGYEYNLTLLAIVFALADLGPGDLSLDEALGLRASGPAWAVAQLLAGTAASFAATSVGSATPTGEASGPADGPQTPERAAAASDGDATPSEDAQPAAQEEGSGRFARDPETETLGASQPA